MKTEQVFARQILGEFVPSLVFKAGDMVEYRQHPEHWILGEVIEVRSRPGDYFVRFRSLGGEAQARVVSVNKLRRSNAPRLVECPDCSGDGKSRRNDGTPCMTCKGAKEISRGLRDTLYNLADEYDHARGYRLTPRVP